MVQSLMTTAQRLELVAHASAVAFWTHARENTHNAAAAAMGVSLANQVLSIREMLRDLQDA